MARGACLLLFGLISTVLSEHVDQNLDNATRGLTAVKPATCGPCWGPRDWTNCDFWGDPHFRKSFFGKKFNYQGMGVHHVASACDDSIVIQDFHCPWNHKRKSVAVGIAVKFQGQVIFMSDKEVTVNGKPISEAPLSGISFSGHIEDYPGFRLMTADRCMGLSVHRKSKRRKSPQFLFNVKLGLGRTIAEEEGLCGDDSRTARRYIPNGSPEMLFTLEEIKSMCRICDLYPGQHPVPLNCLPYKEREKEEEEAWKCKKLVHVRRGKRTNTRFWERQCRRIPRTARMVVFKVKPGITDIFRPVKRASFCEMLTSYRKHQWSPDGTTWRTPQYAGRHEGILGGSKKGWPKGQVGGEFRKRLLSWGPRAGHKFDVHYCEGLPPGAEDEKDETPEEVCKKAKIPIHDARRACDMVKKRSEFDFLSCQIDYCAGNRDEGAVTEVVEEEIEDPWAPEKPEITPQVRTPPPPPPGPRVESMPSGMRGASSATNQAALASLINGYSEEGQGHIGNPQAKAEGLSSWSSPAAVAAACLGLAALVTATFAAPWVLWRRRPWEFSPLPGASEEQALMPLD